MKKIGVGIAGLGVVGGGVVKHLRRNAAILAERTGFEFEVVKVAERDMGRARELEIHPSKVTVNLDALADDPEVQIVVELMGGTTNADHLIRRCLKKGKAVVTANKALLAESAGDLPSIAEKTNTPFCFEASVAGGIPILKALREGLVANRILSIHGIINGTCNYILSSISQTGNPFDAALREAQKLGFAEANPTLDIDGHDTMHKACILAALAYGVWAEPSQVQVQGIRHLSGEDFAFAKKLGYTLKLLAVIRSHPDQSVELHVHPTLVPCNHMLASVSGSFNALAVCGDTVGDTLFYGRGAGADATASAVISDIVDAALAIDQGSGAGRTKVIQTSPSPRIISFEETSSRYYLRLNVEDRPGVLAQIAAIFGKHQIGIRSVWQPTEHRGGQVSLVLLLHQAKESDFRSATAEIEVLDTVCGKAVAIRLEDFES